MMFAPPYKLLRQEVGMVRNKQKVKATLIIVAVAVDLWTFVCIFWYLTTLTFYFVLWFSSFQLRFHRHLDALASHVRQSVFSP
jgi:hypothetical protein